MRRWLPWLALVSVVIAVFLAGRSPGDGPATLDERVTALAREVRCPTCESQSVADSRAPASDSIRAEIRTQLEAGRTPGEVRSFLVSRFGNDILLKPPASGTGSLVWALPVAAFLVAAVALGWGIRRSRPLRTHEPSDDERAAVADALGGQA